MTKATLKSELIEAADALCRRLAPMQFPDPVTHVYNPLRYAAASHHRYLSLARPSTRTLFLGMNPGPWGMAQTGVPFGEVAAVRDFLGIEADVGQPETPHPKRPIQGFACSRSEVSGRRLWGLFAQRFGTAGKFFRSHFVVNYCPLVFMQSTGRNHTPDKLPVDLRRHLDQACDEHLLRVIECLRPKHLVGVGVYAEQRLLRAQQQMADNSMRVHRILHPSPASPAANRGWAENVTATLLRDGVWNDSIDAAAAARQKASK